MPTPFDTPVTTPQPTFGQNLLGALGVTWGKDQAIAAADAARLDQERQRQQQAHVWGPLYKKAGELANTNSEWGVDKVMLELIKSPEWHSASSTPGFDHQNAGKNLYEVVKSTRPTPPSIDIIPKGGVAMATPAAGASDTTSYQVGQGGQDTEKLNRAGEAYEKTETPGGVLPPEQQGPGKLGQAQAAAGQPAEVATPGVSSSPQAGPAFAYEAPDGSDADSPVIPYSHSVKDVPPEIQGIVDESAFQYGINPDLWASQTYKESKWKTNALGPILKDGDRAYGPAQIKGSTWKKEIAPELGFAPMDINDPQKNLIGGAYYMSKMLRKYGGDYTKALMAYNWGQGNVDKWNGDWGSVPDETVDYVLDITNGGVNVPQGLGGRGAGVRTRRAIINTLPDDRPATVEEVNSLVADRKEYMFLGTGFVPWFKNFAMRTGRQLDPTLAKGDENAWQQLEITNRNNLDYLRYSLSKLNRSGDQRLALLAEQAMALFPDDLTQDPLASVTSAINLYKNLTKEFTANERITMANSSSQQVKEAMADNERIMGVIRAMPSLQQMVDMQKLIREGDIVQTAPGAFKQVGTAIRGAVGYATRDFANPKAPPQPPAGLTNTNAPMAGGQGGPQIRKVIKGPDGKLQYEGQ